MHLGGRPCGRQHHPPAAHRQPCRCRRCRGCTCRACGWRTPAHRAGARTRCTCGVGARGKGAERTCALPRAPQTPQGPLASESAQRARGPPPRGARVDPARDHRVEARVRDVEELGALWGALGLVLAQAVLCGGAGAGGRGDACACSPVQLAMGAHAPAAPQACGSSRQAAVCRARPRLGLEEQVGELGAGKGARGRDGLEGDVGVDGRDEAAVEQRGVLRGVGREQGAACGRCPAQLSMGAHAQTSPRASGSSRQAAVLAAAAPRLAAEDVQLCQQVGAVAPVLGGVGGVREEVACGGSASAAAVCVRAPSCAGGAAARVRAHPARLDAPAAPPPSHP